MEWSLAGNTSTNLISSLFPGKKFPSNRLSAPYFFLSFSPREIIRHCQFSALPHELQLIPSLCIWFNCSVAAAMYDFSAGSESVRVGLPPASLFRLPPHRAPDALPPPQLAEPTWYQPFNISASVYGKALDWRVPIAIASVYATTVVLLNRVNARRGFKPYAFSKTKAFKFFVIVHNVFLAIYSTWTFVGMLRAFRASWPRQDEPHGLTAVVDTMCRFNGPHGYGNAAMYNPETLQWTNANPALLAEGAAPSDESGRMWNEGLAYLGWLFYLSKFYEVLDTAIILAKGKKSSTLQTYHHAGAMMCMWSGIRYMASPIWIFTQVNSGIHALMVRVFMFPGLLVRKLTNLRNSLVYLLYPQCLELPCPDFDQT